MNFINLTNGIQAIADFGLQDYRFIRIQSTACEQKRWDDILMSLSDDFMMHAALGHDCVVYDYGARKNIPRAVWQGLEWIKFVLSARWHNKEYAPWGRASSCRGYFDSQYCGLNRRTKARLDYFRRFVCAPLLIKSITAPTAHDGDYAGYVAQLQEICE